MTDTCDSECLLRKLNREHWPGTCVVPCRIAVCPLAKRGVECQHPIGDIGICGLCGTHDSYGTSWVNHEIHGVEICLICNSHRRKSYEMVRQLYLLLLIELVGEIPGTCILDHFWSDDPYNISWHC
jgi:hypothetical protein